MKIDLHCHTKATKTGDGTKRNIPSPYDFIEKLKDHKVGICAITNHNHFDRNQYNEICAIKEDIQI